MNFSEYTTKSIKEVFDSLGTIEAGLSRKEAENRLKIYGPNEVGGDKKTSIFSVFFRQLKSPFFYLLFIASLIACLIGEITDGLLILIFVAINIILGFFQEYRAERAIFLLKKYISDKIRVLRNGSVEIIDKKFLVPGDIVLVEAGDISPADLRVIEVKNFLVDESILSGESVSVAKNPQPLLKKTKEIFEAKNIVFAGTSIVSGEAEGVVVATGKNTAFGEITKLVGGITRESAYEKELIRFSRLILRIVVTTIVILFLLNLIIKGTSNFFTFLLFSLALIVSIIPEALPLVVTFTLSKGALKLAKQKAIVKRLSAVEDLGDIEVLCTDKTGTLTENKLELNSIHSKDKEKCLLFGLLSSSIKDKKSVLSPFDSALFVKASSALLQSLEKFKVIAEIPFDPFRMRNSVLLEDEAERRFLIIKGAPEIILKISATIKGDLTKKEIEKEIKKEGEKGKRTLAIAFKEFGGITITKEDEKDLTFLGYFSFKDPLKETAKEAMHLAGKLGLKIKIVTGDSKEVAGSIAREIGLIGSQEKVILGEEIDSLPEEEFEKMVNDFSVFARVLPTTKLKIVKVLQKKYEVGFVGEGINDTPAIKMANVGIVVQEAADISRQAADVILLQKDLRVIVDAIKNGRNIFSNINKYIKCILASNFGNFYSIAAISLFIPFLPMLPVQILFGNILSDFPLISIATDHIDVEELKKPKLYQLNRLIGLVILLALVSTIFDFIFFGIFYKAQPAIIQTLWFIESILTEIVLIFSIRTRHFFLKTKRPSFPLLFFTIIDAVIIIFLPFTLFGQNFFHFVSPPLSALFIVLSLVFSYFIVSEITKLFYFRYVYKNNNINKVGRFS